jgi:hypothetical protein
MSDWRSRLREGRDDLLGARRAEVRGEPRAEVRGEASEEATVMAQLNETVRKLVTAIVVAGVLIGVGAYFSGSDVDVEAPRYQVTVMPDGRIVRLNTESGTVLVCQGERCGIVVQRGQDLEDEPPPPAALPKEEARPALPVPAQTPDNQAAPAAQR